MKRLVIIAILVVGGVLIFNKENNQIADNNKTNEIVSEEIEAIEEVVVEDISEESVVVEEEKEEIVEDETMEEEVIEKKEETILVPAKRVVTEIVAAKPVVPKVVVPVVVSEVKVYLYDFDIDISQKEVEAGKINFEVLNNGRFAHDFAIVGLKNFGKVRPGETQNFSAFLKAGETELYSNRNQDAEYGMAETIIIR